MGMLYRLISRFCVLLYYLRILSNFAHTGHYLKVIQTTLLILALKSYINETSAHNSTLRCRQWNCGDTRAVLVFNTSGTVRAWCGEWQRNIPTLARSLHLLWECWACSESSRTYTGEPNGWKCSRLGSTSVPDNSDNGESTNVAGCTIFLPFFSAAVYFVGKEFLKLT